MRPLTLDDGEAALPILDAMLAKDPSDRDILNARALLLLSCGRMAEGWAEYHWRIGTDAKIGYGHFPVARWDGGSVAGKHVLAWLEHGVGDQIFGASIIPDLVRAAASVTLFCNRRLAPLFRRAFPGVTVYRVGEPVPRRIAHWDFDCQLSVGGLGRLFRPSLDFKGVPYLCPDGLKMLKLRAKYRAEGRKIVGLAWWSKNHICGLSKSLALADLEPVLRTPGVRFVNLQYGSCGPEIAKARARFGVEIVNDPSVNQLVDLDGFAAQVAAMDFVVTSSVTAAHMAGALGVPGVVMLPRGEGRFWYWHGERSDSPWYPCLRLVRQEAAGDWAAAVAGAAEILESEARCRGLKLTA